jgi:dihydromonapterin reductase / dihydrofolate reductase
MNERISLKNPVIVTGAGSRIGYDIAHHLWLSGYKVVAVCRKPTNSFSNLRGIDVYQCDLTDELQRSNLIDVIKDKYPSIRGIVHNASVWLTEGLEALRTMQALHIEAPYHLNIELEPLLHASGKADVIHIGDETAQRGVLNHIGYAATKAGLNNLTLSFAKKFGPSISVNTISPGFMLAPSGADDHYREKAMSKAIIQCEPGSKPIVEAVLYLLQSKYTTGSDIFVNGGRHLK